MFDYTTDMRIYFAGIGGVGLGPLAEIAADAGYEVSGSDPTSSLMTSQLQKRGVVVEPSQDGAFLAQTHALTPIQWFVYSASLPSDHPELQMARKLGLRMTKRDEFLAYIIKEKNLKLIAIAGTHGKTTTTGMMVWVLKQLGIPVSYAVGTTLSFGPSGKYDKDSQYFVYECDEFDRNMLAFHPDLSLITSLGYDHSDTYPFEQDYQAAFAQFIEQSGHTIGWFHDLSKLPFISAEKAWQLHDEEVLDFSLTGIHNRQNATLVAKACEYLSSQGNLFPEASAAQASADAVSTEAWREAAEENNVAEVSMRVINTFPGTNRRFEKLADNLYSDYGHHPEEIAATLQMARELSDHVVLVYQPHQNVRQHEVVDQYTDCFSEAEKVYWLPTYLSREDPSLTVLTPKELSANVTNREVVEIADLNDALWQAIQAARDAGKLVLCMGAGSIDEWLRHQLAIH
ncbi:UDP-N-acetylmuramate-L-alanine ligase [Candidatus Saccharibacteria bacterium RAAC3_TM7_1]|nr:UDP-N-acetylmuramate-L-alanine ligase [Candidatus Saccharibacteria bacterium RAAC3_TM7_1]